MLPFSAAVAQIVASPTAITVTSLEQGLVSVPVSQNVIFSAAGSEERFYLPLGQVLENGTQLTGTGGTGIEMSCPDGTRLYLTGAFELTLAANADGCSVQLANGGITAVANGLTRVNFGALTAESSGGIITVDYGLENNQPTSQLAVLSGSATLLLDNQSYPLSKGGKYVVSAERGLTIGDTDGNDLAKTADRLARIVAASPANEGQNPTSEGLNGDDALYGYTSLRRQYLDGFSSLDTASGGAQGIISPVENYTLGIELTADTEDLLSVQSSEIFNPEFEMRNETWDIPATDLSTITIDAVNNIRIPLGQNGQPLP